MIHWMTTRATDGKTEMVEVFEDMDVALAMLADDAESDGNKWLSYFMDDNGDVVGVRSTWPASWR